MTPPKRGEVEIHVAGEGLVLHPEKAIYWPAQRVVLVADVHLGKAATFRNLARVAIPSGTTEEMLRRFDLLIQRFSPERMIVLGDLWHAKHGRDEKILAKFQAWRDRYHQLGFALVEGNHDRRTGFNPPELGIEEWGSQKRLGPFLLRHEPDARASIHAPSGIDDDGYVLSGHLHPGVRLSGGGDSVQLPCFWFGEKIAVLPAFGEFTGLARVLPQSGDCVYVITDSRVLSVGSPGPIGCQPGSKLS